jgi:flagellar hook assembly protein FlgD
VVFQGQGTTNAGRNVVVWDGINSGTGAQEPDGVYTLAVTASDASNLTVAATPNAVTIVSGVETGTNGDIMLMSSAGPDVDFNNVTVVREPTRIDTSSTGTGNDTTAGGGDDTTSGGTS